MADNYVERKVCLIARGLTVDFVVSLTSGFCPLHAQYESKMSCRNFWRNSNNITGVLYEMKVIIVLNY